MKTGMKEFSVLVLLSLTVTFSFGQRKYDQADKFSEVLNLLNNYYTDTVNQEKLTEDAIVKVLDDLDPHSSYIPAKDVKKSDEPLVGNFDGIGITFQILKDTIIVLEVIPSGPAERVGLLAGDKIIKVNDTAVAGIKIDNEGVVHKLRGPKGTKVDVSILRHGANGLIDFTITRDKIPIFSVTASYMAAPGVGYIRLERFGANTMDEFLDALNKLDKQGMKDLIFDLQGNTGGYLYTAVDLCNQFLRDSQMIVYTKGQHAPYYPYLSNNHGVFKTGKVVLMVDEGSASAAEIVSGCIQDNDRGLLVGRRTFGKGLVQKPFTLGDGSVVRITTAHYYTPSGRCIQKSYSNGTKEYREDYKERYESGELFGKDTFKFADSLLYHTLNGRNVYGGGGVEPDFFVPYDTSMNSTLLNVLWRRGVENKFCLDYVDRNRQALNRQYATADSFLYHFEVDDNIMAQYFAAAVSDSVIKLKDGTHPVSLKDYFADVKNDSTMNIEKDYYKSEKLLKARAKATIGRNLFDAGLFYRIINSTINDIYAKALQVIQDDRLFDSLKPAAKDDGKKKGRNERSGKKMKGEATGQK